MKIGARFHKNKYVLCFLKMRLLENKNIILIYNNNMSEPQTGTSKHKQKTVSLSKLIENGDIDKVEYDALLDSLKKEGINEVRDDSRLVHAFLCKRLTPQWTRERVVQELCLTYFLYNYTEYPEFSRDVLPIFAKYCHEKAGMPYHVAWSHVHKYMVPQFKFVAIEKAGGLPDTWPWNVKN